MADTDKQTQTPAPAQPSTPEQAEKTDATPAPTEGTETKQPDASFPITAEEIGLIEKESANGFFAECKKAIDSYKTVTDDKAKTEAAKSFLTNWAKEKTVHILKTNESLKGVNELIKDKLSQATELSLEDYVKMVEENPDAKAALLKVIEGGAQGGESTEGQATPPAADNTPSENTSSESGQKDEDEDPDSQWDGYYDTTESEEDPWVRKALSRLRSKKLY